MEKIKLSNNKLIPKLGFGVYQITETGSAEKATYNAIKLGYRLIDTANSYGNEHEVGKGINQAIQEGIVKRKDLYITSKLWVADVNEDRAGAAINSTLKRMNLDYLDLMLIHQPYNDVFGAWRKMEEAYHNNKVKAIGVSNFSIDQITNLAEFSKIKPMVNQIEVNPFCQNHELVDYLIQYGIQPEAWAPFAEGKHDLFNNYILNKIARYHHKSVAQVVLNWLVQRNIIPLAKSVNLNRIQSNLNIFDFKLSDNEIKKINQLDTHQSQFFDHHDPNMIKWMRHRDIKY